MGKEKEGRDLSGIVLAVGVALFLGLFFLLPLLLAVGMWFLVRDRFQKIEYFTLLAFGVLGLAIGYTYAFSSYIGWIESIVTRNFSVGALPWFSSIAISFVLLGIIGLLSSSRLTARVPTKFLGTGKKSKEPLTLLPTDTERAAAASVVSVPGGNKVTKTTVIKNEPVGKRSFAISIGKTGAPVMLSEAELRTHMVLLGATGSGKTETIKVIAGSLLDMGWSGLVLDMKEDTQAGGLRDWLKDYSMYHQVPFQQLCLSAINSETWFNPLTGLGPDEMRDLILALQEFDDAYWQAINKELLGQLLNLMVWAHQADPAHHPAPSMYELGKILGSGTLKTATKKMIATVEASQIGFGKEDFGLLLNPPQATAQSATGYAAKLNQIFETQAGRQVLRPGTGGQKHLLDVTAPGLCYVGLDLQGKKDLANMISAAVLQRMSVFAAARTTGLVSNEGGNPPRFLIVDEAGWVNRDIVSNLLARARGAGIAMILCTQGPKDWIDKQGDDWGKLTQNTNVAVFMNQGEPESATMCADFIGKEWKTVSSTMNRTAKGILMDSAVRDEYGRIVEAESSREEYLHIVDPDSLRRMQKGDIVVRIGNPYRLEWGNVRMRDAQAGDGRWYPVTLE